MNYKALIVEDEINNAKFLNYLVDSYSPSIEVIAIAIDLQEAKNMIFKYKPDIIFLDIEIGNNNGFEIFETINPNDVQIIFTTAHEEFAIDAIKIAAADYLIKPIDIEEFIAGTKKVIANLGKQNNTNQEFSYQKNSKPKRTNSRLAVPVKNEVNVVKLDTIVYLEAQGKYTMLYLLDGQELLSSTNIGYFEETIDNNIFLRVHKTFMVNINLVKKVVKGEGYYCIMENNKSVPVSRRRHRDLKEKLGI
jgi:two-component system LytT family response regulator